MQFVHEASSTRVVFGSGTVSALGGEIDRLGARRVLMISNASARRPVREAEATLDERVVARIDEVRLHVPEEDARAASEQAMAAHVDCMVAVGGGSAIGLAKGVAVQTGISIVAIPTTYSGSEMTPIYGMSSEGRKGTGRDEKALPRTVIYDPALTTDLPARATASTGMNAIAHAVEALYARDPDPVIEAKAVEALRHLHRGLLTASRDGGNLEGRETALYGAFLAGESLAAAGMALHHTLSQTLGGISGLPHGAVNAVLLPHVVSYNEPAARKAVARVADAFGADDAAGGLFDFAQAIGAPTTLRALGLERDSLAEVARVAAEGVKWNPREVDEEDILGILLDAYEGTRP
jgi:alcohol dehydrogenase class IV